MSDNFIFAPRGDQNDIDNYNNISTEYFTVIGLHESIDQNNRPVVNANSSNILAKQVVSNNGVKYFIKTGPNGKIFNPMGMFSEGNNNKFLARLGKNQYNFKSVNQEIFNMYLNFLSTKNLAWLNNAERGLI